MLLRDVWFGLSSYIKFMKNTIPLNKKGESHAH